MVIVESPAKAKTINKYLGKDYIVRASMGHVRDLPKSKMGVDLENGFIPSYITLTPRKKMVTALKKELKDADNLYLAPDPDREGEAIAWHLAEALGFDKKKTFRVTFNEITSRAIKDAFIAPRKVDMDKVESQQARRILDRIVGYKISPLLWKKVGSGLSAGRVQSVAVRIICDREAEIEGFVAKEYWSIEVLLEKKDEKKEQFWAELKKIEGKKIDVDNEKHALDIQEAIMKEEFVVKDIRERQKRENASPPFITSQLQQAAVNKFGWSINNTMRIAQQLYEGLDIGPDGMTGLITYMRTDSYNISQQAKDEAKEYILKNHGDKYIPESEAKYKKKKGAQEAHECIRPSSVLLDPEKIKQYLSSEQYRLYKLIWQRFLASQMAPAVYLIMAVDIEAGKCLFHAGGSTVLFDGHTVVSKHDQKEAEEDAESAESKESSDKKNKYLPQLTVGELLSMIECKPGQHFTKPPPRYTEATLVRALEENGIGRPSTYAPTIQTIIKRSYVTKEKRSLFPTELGKSVTQLLVDHFPHIVEVDFTAEMETFLDNIEKGKMGWQRVLEDFYGPFAKTYDEAVEKMKDVKKVVIETDEVCGKCGKPMVIKLGRHGQFMACSGFPDCKHTRSIPTGVKCPQCDGNVVKRKSKRGSTFYGCDQYPNCKYVSKFLNPPKKDEDGNQEQKPQEEASNQEQKTREEEKKDD